MKLKTVSKDIPKLNALVVFKRSFTSIHQIKALFSLYSYRLFNMKPIIHCLLRFTLNTLIMELLKPDKIISIPFTTRLSFMEENQSLQSLGIISIALGLGLGFGYLTYRYLRNKFTTSEANLTPDKATILEFKDYVGRSDPLNPRLQQIVDLPVFILPGLPVGGFDPRPLLPVPAPVPAPAPSEFIGVPTPYVSTVAPFPHQVPVPAGYIPKKGYLTYMWELLRDYLQI